MPRSYIELYKYLNTLQVFKNLLDNLYFNPYFLSKITRTIPTPIITTGLDKRFVADDATPCTVFPATFATVPIVCPIVLPAVLATVLIDPVTVPTI